MLGAIELDESNLGHLFCTHHTYSHYRGKTYPRRPHRGARFFKSRYLSLSASRVSRRILNHICDDAGQKHGFWPYDDEPASQLRSEEHTSELQSLMRISYAVLCLKKK